MRVRFAKPFFGPNGSRYARHVVHENIPDGWKLPASAEVLDDEIVLEDEDINAQVEAKSGAKEAAASRAAPKQQKKTADKEMTINL